MGMHAAAREITWVTPSGLCFEYTKLVGARFSEQKLVEIWGSLGNAKAPILEWKDWAITHKDEVKVYLTLKTALDNVDNSDLMEEGIDNNPSTLLDSDSDDEALVFEALEINDEVDEEEIIEFNHLMSLERIDEESCSSESNSSESDDSSQSRVEKPSAEELSDSNNSSGSSKLSTSSSNSSESSGDSVEEGSVPIPLIKNILKFCDEREKALKVKTRLEEQGKKTKFVDTTEDYKKEAQEALESGPQSSPLELLLQLECHERLHRQYVSKNLSPCLFSFYLEVMKKDRWALLHWLGSGMIDRAYVDQYSKPPDVPLRLNKIPPGWELLGDKGFDGTDRFFPNFNPVRTPLMLRTRQVKQYLRDEIFGEGSGNRPLCRLRYTSEVAFSRVTQLDSLKDTISYHNFGMLQHMHSWGHAQINLNQPLRVPGYWNEVNEVV
eukprot:scaffold551240_cov134-Attheya_sp.AAC.1